MGRFAPARTHLEQSLALYDSQRHHAYGSVWNPGVVCLCVLSQVLYLLGYPDQALKTSQEALALAQQLSHPFSLSYALGFASGLRRQRGEQQAVQELAAAKMELSQDQGFAEELATTTVVQGWLLVEQGQEEKGVAQMRQGMAAWRATGAETGWLFGFTMLAEAYGKVGQTVEGLKVLDEALTMVNRTGRCELEAELYRLKGELSLQSEVRSPKSEITSPQHPTPSTQAEAEAEACFHKAIEIARRQQAKSLELRAVMSLSRLWQRQGKKEKARQMLAEIYDWFTEGFDTKDLQEAKALLQELA
jgi:predicted ATPase